MQCDCVHESEQNKNGQSRYLYVRKTHIQIPTNCFKISNEPSNPFSPSPSLLLFLVLFLVSILDFLNFDALRMAVSVVTLRYT